MFGNCNHCCFCCGHSFTMLGVSLFISCKNKIQCVCEKKNGVFNYLVITSVISDDFDPGNIVLICCLELI